MSRCLATMVCTLALVGAGCGDSTGGSGGNAGSGGLGGSGGIGGAGGLGGMGGTGGTGGSGGTAGSGGTGGTGGTGGGGNTISGTVNGHTFNNVVTALWAGMPDSASTEVVYLFDHAVSCNDISAVGWDTRITNMTQVLELKAVGTTAMSYTVTSSLTPAPGEANASYTLSSTTGTPSETVGSTGTIVLQAINPSTNITGTFNVTFAGGGSLTGTFNAAYCAGGKEP